MKILRLTLAVLLTFAVPITAVAGPAHDDGCSGHQVTASITHPEHADHHGNAMDMDHGADQADCGTDCQCPTLHCSAGSALINHNARNADTPIAVSLPVMALSNLFPGYSNTPYRPPNRG